VEIQILADSHGNMIHLGERECSVQRRHQKLLEEAPSPALTDSMRRAMGRAAIKLAKAASYKGAGTVEFVVSGKEFFFIEVNCRIQVEHPITEFISGVDLVREQIRAAAGEKLSKDQRGVRLRGHAIEVRINAEDPAHGFRPSPGLITHFVQPGGPGVRVDTHVHAGYRVPPAYDSLVAKLIVHAADRSRAIDCLTRALDEFVIEGIETTLPVHREIVRNAFFREGNYDTGLIEEFFGG